MLKHILQSSNKSDEMTRQPLHPYRSVWMAHWTHTTCKPTTPVNQQLLDYEPRGDGHNTRSCPLLTGPEVSTDSSKHAVGFKGLVKVKTNNDFSDGLTTSSKKLRNEIFKPFPMFNVSKESTLAVKSDQMTLHHQGLFRLNNSPHSGFISSPSRTEKNSSPLPVCAPPETGTSSRECLFLSEGIIRYPEQQVMPIKTLGKDSSAASSSSHNDFALSTTKIVPHGINKGGSSGKALLHTEDKTNLTSSVMASKEHFSNSDYDRHSSLFVKEKPIYNQALLVQDPSPSNSEVPGFLCKRQQKRKNDRFRLFPSRSNPLEETESENLHHQSYSEPRFPCFVHDVETMRVCNAVDSTVESSRGPPPFVSQTTDNFMIKDKNNLNVSDGSQMFRESMVSTKCKGKMVSELLSLSPDFIFQVPPGVKLQALDGHTQIGRKGINGGVETSAVQIRTESSAETDTMDMTPFREDHVSGMASSSSNKDVLQMSPKAHAVTASVEEETGDKLLNAKLPDMNQEPPALAGIVGFSNDRETSTSRTQSLNADHLLSHAEWRTDPKFTAYNNELGPEPSSRWIKRLKSGVSGSSGYGTKSLKMGEASLQEKFNNLFGKMSKHSMASPDPQMEKCHGKQLKLLDQTVVTLRNSGSSSDDLMGKSDITLSHPWIRRWCRHRHQVTSPQSKAEARVICEPQHSKATIDEYQKKQFPSVAAIALMGKAMSGFQPCGFTKKGPVLVWNSE